MSFVEILSKKLLDESVLFFIGAGLSLNWGLPSGRELADWISSQLDSDAGDKDILEQIKSSLPEVAEIVAPNKGYLLRKVLHHYSNRNFFKTADEFLKNRDPVSAGDIGVPHIVVGRLAKEELIQEVMTVNYDCLIEAGCQAVGMMENGSKHMDVWRYPWPETYRVVADHRDILESAPGRHVFHVHKIHGCIARFRKKVAEVERMCSKRDCRRDAACPDCPMTQDKFNFVITYRELADWRQDRWARDLFFDRVRTHHVVFAGVHGSDTVLHAALRAVYDEVWASKRNDRTLCSPSSGVIHSDDNSQTPAQQQELCVGQGHSSLPIQEIRAQATEYKRNFYMRQILGSAAGGPVVDETQIWPLCPEDAAKSRMEALFRSTYVSCVQKLLLRQVQWYWTPWAEEVLRQEARKEFAVNPLRQAEHARSRLEKAITTVSDEAVWYTALPTATRFSWALGQDYMEWDESFLRRLAFPNYYVPISCNYRFVFPLVAFYAFLHALSFGPRWVDGGWVLLRSPARIYSQHLIFPVVAPRDDILARRFSIPLKDAYPPTHLLRSGCVEPVLVLIGNPSEKVLANITARAGACSALGTSRIRLVPLSYHQLMDEGAFLRWRNEFLQDGSARGN